LPAPEVGVAALVLKVEERWQWLASHPDHPDHDAFLEKWIARLHEYEEVYRAHERITA
jgi:hypothetical protein